jgi:16S rRNA C967 or C1407 C5-methylase (RsmB/RsmF family)
VKGPAGFDHYYGEVYGERWAALRKALLSDQSAVAISVGGHPDYFLDAASIVPALALEVVPGQSVVDLCAAPGGKTLILAAMLRGAGSLSANDRSANRRTRLRRVISEHLPEELRAPIHISGHDAARWALHNPCSCDRILADVPCSSEQHVLQSEQALAQWSSSRTRRLSQGAYAIACAAADSLKADGLMVYSTCALSPRENDEVIGRLLTRSRGNLTVEQSDAVSRLNRLTESSSPDNLSVGRLSLRVPAPLTLSSESTEFGEILLPDRNAGGPIYFALIRRIACNSA